MKKEKEYNPPTPIPERADVVIGIDPDADKSGASVLRKEKKYIETHVLEFADLIRLLMYETRKAQTAGKSCVVVIEGGWLNKGNWHLSPADTKFSAAAKGRSMGMNHQTGILTAEVCKAFDIPHVVVKPLRKIWQGKDRKITHDELASFATLSSKRENQEARDAALLAWVYAGLPIRVGRPR